MACGNRGAWALRVPFEHLGVRAYPGRFSLAQTHRAFDDDGQIRDEELRRRFSATIPGSLISSWHRSTTHAPGPPGWSTSANALNRLSTACNETKDAAGATTARCCNPDLTTIRPASTSSAAGWLEPRTRAIRLSYAEDDRWTQVGFGASGGGRVVHPNGIARTSQACASYGTSQG